MTVRLSIDGQDPRPVVLRQHLLLYPPLTIGLLAPQDHETHLSGRAGIRSEPIPADRYRLLKLRRWCRRDAPSLTNVGDGVDQQGALGNMELTGHNYDRRGRWSRGNPGL